jgi:hypothetical protein
MSLTSKISTSIHVCKELSKERKRLFRKYISAKRTDKRSKNLLMP